jgi:NADPH:quinone reductase-like Zn-dependent oxidoreductase
VESAGYKPIAICSPTNYDLVKSRGAIAAFDYKDPNCVEEVKKYTGGNLSYIWDTICSASSAKLCAELIATGGVYGTLVNVEWPRSDVKKTWSLGYTAFGEPIEKRGNKMHKPQDFEFMKKWVAEVEPILASGKIQVHPTEVGQGIENVLEGMDRLRHNKVSGKKLIYKI